MKGFVTHLLWDGFGCPHLLLDDLEALTGLLESLPGRIGATASGPALVQHDPGRGRAFSGCRLLPGGHVALHADPARGWAGLDVCSRAGFDLEGALREVSAALRPRRVEWKLLDRGPGFARLPGAGPRAGRARTAGALTLSGPGTAR